MGRHGEWTRGQGLILALAIDRDRSCQLTPIHCVRRVEETGLALSGSEHWAGRDSGRNGGGCECGVGFSGASRYGDLFVPLFLLRRSVPSEYDRMGRMLRRHAHEQVEMFKIRMQGQYGGSGDKKLGAVIGDMWSRFGFRDGIMRGYWVRRRVFAWVNGLG